MINIPALDFIPQRPPFVLVDNIVDCDDVVIVTDFSVPQEHVLVRQGMLTAPGVMENIAQTCAARIGWMNRNKPVRIGVIGSISKLNIVRLPKVGELLHTKVTVESEVFEATIVHAQTFVDEVLVAECDMKVFLV